MMAQSEVFLLPKEHDELYLNKESWLHVELDGISAPMPERGVFASAASYMYVTLLLPMVLAVMYLNDVFVLPKELDQVTASMFALGVPASAASCNKYLNEVFLLLLRLV